jgi:glycosyltransferase involved in cell wall biosynthesis
MKIGIDCHNLEGQRTGVGRYLANLLREWESQTDTEFFLYFKSAIPEDIHKLSQHTTGWTLRNFNAKSNVIFKHWILPRAAARDGVDVLFCPDYVLPFYTGVGIKIAVTIHDIIYEARPSEYSWPSWKDKILLKWASKQSAKKADAIFAPSKFTKSEILKYYRVNSEKIVITPLAADLVFNRSGSDPDRLGKIRQGYGIRDKYIFFVGSIFNRRFLPQKIQAFAEFGKQYPDFQFLIVGKDHTKPFQDIAALVVKVNQVLGREAVVWREQASDEDLVHLYSGAFATLWLSSYEGFGLPVLESMACGTPAIITKKASLPEIAGDAAMYIAHPENPQEIASALGYLVRSNTYYNELIERGFARVKKFSWQKCASDTLRGLTNI